MNRLEALRILSVRRLLSTVAWGRRTGLPTIARNPRDRSCPP